MYVCMCSESLLTKRLLKARPTPLIRAVMWLLTGSANLHKSSREYHLLLVITSSLTAFHLRVSENVCMYVRVKKVIEYQKK